MTSPGEPARTIQLVLIERMGIVRASLRMIFDAEPDMVVAGEAGDVDGGLEEVRRLIRRSDAVVFVGLEFDGERDAFWLIRAIRNEFPQMIVLATGTDLDTHAISQGLFSGADGFVHKNSEPERFVEAARRAVEGELVLKGLPRGALGGIVEGMEEQRVATSVLTPREEEVLVAAAEGLTSREIGRRLGVRERTVTTHLDHIYRKLGTSGRVAAVAAATRLGILPLDRLEPVRVPAASLGGQLVAG